MLPPLVLDAQGCAFLLGIRWSGMYVPPQYYMLRDVCSLMVIDARGFVVFPHGNRCSGMCCITSCYCMLRDVFSPFLLHAQVCVPPFVISSGSVFLLVVTCSGMCVSPCYYMLRNMCFS